MNGEKILEVLISSSIRLLKQMGKRLKHVSLLFNSSDFIKTFIRLMYLKKYRKFMDQTLGLLRNIVISDCKTSDSML